MCDSDVYHMLPSCRADILCPCMRRVSLHALNARAVTLRSHVSLLQCIQAGAVLSAIRFLPDLVDCATAIKVCLVAIAPAGRRSTAALHDMT